VPIFAFTSFTFASWIFTKFVTRVIYNDVTEEA
jgi:hypothetical protein